jgi:hypothetical protein
MLCVVGLHLAVSTVSSFGPHWPVFELADVTPEGRTPESFDDNLNLVHCDCSAIIILKKVGRAQ